MIVEEPEDVLLMHTGPAVQFYLDTSAIPSTSVRWYHRPGFADERGGGVVETPVEEAEMGSR